MPGRRCGRTHARGLRRDHEPADLARRRGRLRRARVRAAPGPARGRRGGRGPRRRLPRARRGHRRRPAARYLGRSASTSAARARPRPRRPSRPRSARGPPRRWTRSSARTTCRSCPATPDSASTRGPRCRGSPGGSGTRSPCVARVTGGGSVDPVVVVDDALLHGDRHRPRRGHRHRPPWNRRSRSPASRASLAPGRSGTVLDRKAAAEAMPTPTSSSPDPVVLPVVESAPTVADERGAAGARPRGDGRRGSGHRTGRHSDRDDPARGPGARR